MARGRFGRRAVLRAALGGAVAAALGSPRPLRRLRGPAVAGAVVAGAALELPAAGLAAAAAAGFLHRRSPERPRPATAAAAVALGVVAATATRRIWPVAPRTPARIAPAYSTLGGEPSLDGRGLSVVVNPSAGPALRRSPRAQLEEAFPGATIVEPDGDVDLGEVLDAAAADAVAIGVAGGDGSVGAAARVAHRTRRPLVVVPAGTLNHLARDLGIHSVDDAVEAVKQGELVAVDVAAIDGRPFLNTASFGVYSELVDARERIEDAIGKWPALVVALWRVLRRSEPVEVELDGRRRRLWMMFVGNCRYHPAGFAPSWRERLDDGVLDVRIVDAEQPWARTRLLAAVLTGRLGRCRAYEATTARRLVVRSVNGPLRLSCDGETFDGSAEFEICKEPEPLAVYVLPAAAAPRAGR